MIAAQSTGSASPTSLALHISGEEKIMAEYTVSISEDGVWAGSGLRDSYGHIQTAAVLSAAPDDKQHRIYDEIEEAVTEAIAGGQSTARIEVNGYRYTMMIEAMERC